MEPAVSSSEEGFVCPTCGDEGFTNAFVYCIKCLDVAIHRYCLNVMPNTLNEVVIWYCENCQVKSSLSQKEKAANSRHVKAKKKQKKQWDITSLITGTKEFNCQENITELAHNIPNKNCTNGEKIAASLDAKEKENKIQQRKKRFVKDCSMLAGLLREWKFLDESQPSNPSCEHKILISDSSFTEKELGKANNHECQGETGSNLSQSVDFENNIQDNYYRYAQPVFHPIWRGSFTIIGKKYDQFEGFVAHLSNKACDKVLKEANMLTSSLHLEMHPKTELWPESFQDCGPSDDKISLYFFPGNPINVKAFDNLVLDMMDKGLAMRATTKRAELLIFTSMFLPPLFRSFQGKYYLWGVFRGNKNDPLLVVSHDLSKDSPNEGINVKKTVKIMKTLDAHSPRSHLSNNSIDDLVEPFVEYFDKATGQTVLCERSEYNHDCDVLNMKRLEISSGERLEYIHRYCSNVMQRTPRDRHQVPEPPSVAEWIHPRLSQHHPLVQRKLFMQKLSPTGPLILEKSIKRAVFVRHGIFECFMRIGWGGVLDFEADEVYPEPVIEWMSTLERTGSTVENMKLTGQVNGKKATLDIKFIRENFGVDTGIIGHPGAQYEYLTEEILFGKEQNVKQWKKMADSIFTTVSEGALRKNLAPLAKVLWRIGMRNIHPRVRGERAVCRHEVPIIYGLATGNLAISYAHLVMMNIWTAYEFKEMRFIPHSYLISRFLKLKNVVPRNLPPKMIQENTRFIARLNFDSMVFYQEEGQQK